MSNPDKDIEDFFGSSLSAYQGLGYARILVGASSDDNDGTGAGRAYLFDSTGTLVSTLISPSPTNWGGFGKSVALSFNGTTYFALVGAPYEGTGGKVHVYDAITGNYLRTLANPSPSAGDYFGWAVAASGSLALVGSYGDDIGSPPQNEGRAFTYDLSTGAHVATLTSPNPKMNVQFGKTVAIDGDIAVVGAPADKPDGVSGTQIGVVYVFDGISGTHNATLNNPTPVASEFFGSAVAISEDHIVVGCAYDSPSGVSQAGSVYTFTCP